MLWKIERGAFAHIANLLLHTFRHLDDLFKILKGFQSSDGKSPRYLVCKWEYYFLRYL